MVRAYGLEPGDSIGWNFGDDEITVQFFKVTTNAVPVEKELAAAE